MLQNAAASHSAVTQKRFLSKFESSLAASRSESSRFLFLCLFLFLNINGMRMS